MSTPELESRLRHELGAAADRVASDTRFPVPLRERVQHRRRRNVFAARAGVFAIAVVVVGAAVLAGPSSRDREPIAPATATDRIDDPVELSFEVEELPPSPLSARLDPSAVWTGRELIVWGGTLGRQPLADGAAYDPSTRTWRMLAAAPIPARGRHVAVWTGTEMVVAGGVGGPDGQEPDRFETAAYDPATDTWRALPPLPADRQLSEAAVVAGRVVLAGSSRHGGPATLLVLDPAASAWEVIEVGTTVASLGAAGDRVVITTEEYSPSSQVSVALVDPVTGTVEPAPSLGEASAFRAGTAVWTGERVVVAVIDLLGDMRTHLLAWAPGEPVWTAAATVPSQSFSPDVLGIDPGAARWIDGWMVISPTGPLLAAAAPANGNTVQADVDLPACGASAGLAFADDDAYYVAAGQFCEGPDANDAVATVHRVRIITD